MAGLLSDKNVPWLIEASCQKMEGIGVLDGVDDKMYPEILCPYRRQTAGSSESLMHPETEIVFKTA